ncbi:MAG: PD-(D/E)XK nuclease-like domain-containing protein [Ahrensia sp.]|nr:PD-(D/E)XK nuclease-like domain-containing protein [Ahrensia sp.]
MIDGIYFNMPFHEYLSINRLSNTALQKLMISPATFWASSWLNPNKPSPDDTKAQILGRAYHAARFEPKAFHDQFTRALEKADYDGIDGALFNGAEIGEALFLRGESKKKAGETVLEQSQRLQATGYDGPIWPIKQAAWAESIGARIPIPADHWNNILADMKRIDAIPEISKLMRGGAAEVTVLWTEKGVPFKARFDKLKPKLFLDFKTFENSQGKNLDHCISDAIRFNRYYIQIAFYYHVTELIRKGALEVIGDASPDERALIEAVRGNPDDLEAWLVFQEKRGVPNIVARKVQLFTTPLSNRVNGAGLSDEVNRKVDRMTRHKSALLTKAEWEINRAVTDFVNYSEIYEPGQEWVPFNPIGETTDEDFPQYWFE